MPVASMAGTFFMRRMKTFGVLAISEITSSSFAAAPKKNGPLTA